MRTSGMVPSTSSSASSDLVHQVPLYAISSSTEYCVDHGKSLGSMNMEDLLQNIYAENSPFITDCEAGDATVDRMFDQNMKRNGSNGTQRSVEDMWRDISSSDRKIGREGMGLVGMTLEDYLARAGVVGEEAVGVRVATSPRFKPKGVQTGGVKDSVGLSGPYGQQQKTEEVPIVGFGNELVEAGGDVVGARGRGRIRGLAQDQTEKVAQQRQKRMIKNRESAARSRERKQAYTVELETLVIKLEKENSSLKHEQVDFHAPSNYERKSDITELQEERRRNRLKQLKEDRIPVVERKKQQHHLRRTLSMQW